LEAALNVEVTKIVELEVDLCWDCSAVDEDDNVGTQQTER